MGLSQRALADKIGLTYQQIQKYENGSNRMSAGTLYHLGCVLGVPLDYFGYGFDNQNGKTLISTTVKLNS